MLLSEKKIFFVDQPAYFHFNNIWKKNISKISIRKKVSSTGIVNHPICVRPYIFIFFIRIWPERNILLLLRNIIRIPSRVVCLHVFWFFLFVFIFIRPVYRRRRVLHCTGAGKFTVPAKIEFHHFVSPGFYLYRIFSFAQNL